MTRHSRDRSLAEPPVAAVERAEIDRRSNARLTWSELPWVNRVRLRYGPSVAVLDLSRGGAQIEIEAHPLQPGSTVVLEITAEGSDLTVPAQVVRSQVTGLSPRTIYRGGLSFKSAIDFPIRVSESGPARRDEFNPLQDHARLSLALRRRASPFGQTVAPVTSVGADALAAALAMIEAPEARQAGASFARELSRLFRSLTEGLDQQAAPEDLLRLIAGQLRRVVPARAIRFAETKSPSDPRAAHAPLSVDVPSNDDGRDARLLIDLPGGCSLQDWHFPYLKAAVYLIAAVRNLPRVSPAEATQQAQRERFRDLDLPAAWHRVVVRYADGRLLKGYSREFTVSSTALQVWPSPGGPLNTLITVSPRELKAVFFVRDFDGDPEHVEDSSSAVTGHGRLIAVTFVDGETLVGTTLNYSADAAGFFVRAVDGESNNLRVFVASEAVLSVQFPSPTSKPDRSIRDTSAKALAV